MPEADLDIDSIAAGGDGVGRMDGLVAFVPRTAPGDRARIRYASGGATPRRDSSETRGFALKPEGSRRRFARGELLRLLRESPTRTTPSCPHYTRDHCGGCQLQHLSYDAQLDAKARIIRDALARIGKREIPLPDVVPSPRQWRYRSKLTLAMRRQSGHWIAGLHPYTDPAAVFALDDCPITDDEVLVVWRSILAVSAFLPSVPELRAAVQITDATVSFTLEGATDWPHYAEFFAAVPTLTELWLTPDGSAPRLLATRTATAIGASFAQINSSLSRMLHDDVVERAWRYAPAHVVDAYAGRGATALALSARGARVTAIEVDRAAAARTAEHLPSGSRSIAARVEDALPAALPADVVLLNPPRTGVAEPVTTALAGPAGPPAIIYVSCDPATLARDVARLAPYRIAAIRAFDMFPQTAHVETVCELVR